MSEIDERDLQFFSFILSFLHSSQSFFRRDRQPSSFCISSGFVSARLVSTVSVSADFVFNWLISAGLLKRDQKGEGEEKRGREERERRKKKKKKKEKQKRLKTYITD